MIVLGGDARQVAVIRALTGAGCAVYAAGLCGAAGLPEGVRLCGSLAACLRAAGETGAPEMLTLLLPLPVSRDGETVHCPLEPTAHIPLSDIADVLDSVPETRLLGGCLPADFRAELARRLGADGAGRAWWITTRWKRFRFQTPASPPRRAVMTAMELTDTALLGSRMAVIGYGRIGQFLARLLLAMGVSVTVCARRAESLAFARGDGWRDAPAAVGRQAAGLSALAHGYDVIFNTVPAPVLGRRLLEETDPRTLILDLASAPGGVDPEASALFAAGGEGAAVPAGRAGLPWHACLRIVRRRPCRGGTRPRRQAMCWRTPSCR